MQLIEVKDRKQIKQWIDFPRIIHKNDPNWIPALRQDVEKVFDPKRNKTFEHGEAIRWLLTGPDGKVIGRIAAFVNEKYPNPLQYPVGGMGFFDCINDQEAANTLLDAAKKWLLDRGMEGMDGPINFGEKNMFWGLLIENFKEENTYGMDLHPPYYRELLENYGFRIFYEQHILKRPVKNTPATPEQMRLGEIIMKRYNIEVRDVRGLSIKKIAEDFMTVYNDAWGGMPGFKKMKPEAGYKIIKSMKAVMDPRVVIFAYHDDEPIGFFVSLPELNQIFKHVNGNLNAWGKIKFLYYKTFHKPRILYGLVFGVVRKWQRKGVDMAIARYGSLTIVDENLYDELVMTWIGDFNPKMLAIGAKVGATISRKYATLRLNFDPKRPFERHPVVNLDNQENQV